MNNLQKELLNIEKKILELKFEKQETKYKISLKKTRELIELKKQGKTYAEIGRIKGLTRQRIHQIIA